MNLDDRNSDAISQVKRKMAPRNSSSQSRTQRVAKLCLTLFVVTLAVGCNTESESPVTVSPPPISVDLSKTASEPPGKMELPQGAITGGVDLTTEEIQSDTTAPGGIEMPVVRAGKVQIQYATWQEVEAMAKSSGKVTVVDIWSTACAPCIKELPGLVELHNTLGDRVHCIALDIDFDGRKSKPAQTYENDVTAILTSLQATFTNVISTTPSDDIYATANVDSIPAVLVYDASGTLVKKFVDAGASAGFSYHKDVTPAVKALLN